MSNKRRRIGEAHASTQSTSHDTSHGTNVPSPLAHLNASMTKQVSRYLEQLPSVLFAHVCTFLDMKCKCWSLSILSHCVRDLFNPALCCRGLLRLYICAGIVDVNGPTEDQIKVSVDNVNFVAPYLKYASSIDIECSISETNYDAFVQVNAILAQRLSCSNLVGLTIVEHMSTKPRLIAFILTCLKQSQPHRLSSLIKLDMYLLIEEEDSLIRNDQLMDWIGLNNCQALESLTLGFGSPLVSDYEQAIILVSLPSSLTHLDVMVTEGANDHPPLNDMLCQCLCSPQYLPHLRSYRSDNSYALNGPLFRGLTTVMTETGQMRPFEDLTGFPMNVTDQWVPFTWASHLQAVLFELNETSLALFAGQSDDVLCKLKSVIMTLQMSEESANVAPLDLSDLFIFLSKRPVEHITLRMHCYGPNDEQEYRKCSALSSTAIQQLLQLNALRLFNILAAEVLFDTCLFANAVESINCWPMLKSVNITGSVWGPDNIILLFKSAPGLSRLCSDIPVPWSTMLPVISHYCPDIEHLSDYSNSLDQNERFARYVTLPELQAAFAPYPISDNSFHKLRYLNFGFEIFAPAALHFLCSHLAMAPLISFTTFQNGLSELALCIVLRKLQSIKFIPGFIPFILSALDSECEQFLNTYESKVDGVEGSEFSKALYTMSDTPPLNGREGLLNLVLTWLMDEELMCLERWDAGEYSTKLFDR